MNPIPNIFPRDKCSTHKSAYEFGCYDCKKRLCSFCLNDHQNHEFENWEEIENNAKSLIEDFTRDFLDQISLSRETILSYFDARKKILHSQVNFACNLLRKQIKQLEANTINQIDFICDRIQEYKLAKFFQLPDTNENLLENIDPSLELIKKWKDSKCLKSYIDLTSRHHMLKRNFSKWKELEREKEFNQDINLLTLEMKNISLDDVFSIKTDSFSFDLLCNESVQEVASEALSIMTRSKFKDRNPIDILTNLDNFELPNTSTVDPGIASVIITKLLYFNRKEFLDIRLFLEQPLFILFPIREKIRSLELAGEWKLKENRSKNDLLCLLITCPQLRYFTLFSPSYDPVIMDSISKATISVNFRKIEEIAITFQQNNPIYKKELKDLLKNSGLVINTIRKFKISAILGQNTLFEVIKESSNRSSLKLIMNLYPLGDSSEYIKCLRGYSELKELELTLDGTISLDYLRDMIANLNLCRTFEKISMNLIHRPDPGNGKEARFIDAQHIIPLRFSEDALISLSLNIEKFYFGETIVPFIFKKIIWPLKNLEELSLAIIEPYFFSDDSEIDVKLQPDNSCFKKLRFLELIQDYRMNSQDLSLNIMSLATLPRLDHVELYIRGNLQDEGIVNNIIPSKWKIFALKDIGMRNEKDFSD